MEIEATPKEVQKTKDILLEKVSVPKRVKIVIPEQEGEDNQGDVFISVNGRAYQIKRGFEVEVPPEVIEVLDHAISTKMSQDMRTMEMSFKDVPRFPYKVIS